MRPLQTDLSIYQKFDFERPPVGVKFLFFRPEGMEPLAMDKNLSFCEMLVEAQKTANPFYFGTENNETCVGKILLGMQDMEPFAESGQIGARLESFRSPVPTISSTSTFQNLAKGRFATLLFPRSASWLSSQTS